MKTALKFALAGASAIAFAAPGYAQTADGSTVTGDDLYQANTDQGVATADVIVVEGRRRLESEQDVPQTINVVTQEDLQKLNLRDGADIASVVPGLSLTTNGNGIAGNASIRGVNFDTNVSGNNPTVEFYLNDAPIAVQNFLQANYDIGQIETLRGPQGTLRGRASPSGAITIRTRRPDLYDFGGYVDATGNDIGGLNFNGAVGIPIVEGVLGLRLAGLYAEDEVNRVKTVTNDGTIDNRDPLGETVSARASLLFEPTDWFNLFASYQYLDRDARYFTQYSCNPFGTDGSVPAGNDSQPGPCSPDLDGEDRRSIFVEPFNTTFTSDIYNATATFSFAGQNLIYTGNYTDTKLTSQDPNDEGNILPPTTFVDPDGPGPAGPLPFFNGALAAGLPNEIFLRTQTLSKNESHELRLQNDERLFNGLLDYVVGGFLYKTDSPSDLIDESLINLPGAFVPPPQGPVPFPIIALQQTPITRPAETEEKSVFANITVHPLQGLEISGGLRYIDYESDDALIGATPAPLVNSSREETTIYTASASYDITPDIMAYATFGTSWRPPVTAIGCFDTNCGVGAVGNFLNIEAEESESYEIGIKTQMFDNRLRLNVSAYHQDFTNYPYRAPGAGVFFVSNGTPGDPTAGVDQFNFISGVPVEVNGVEAEISYEFSRNFNLGALLSYADGKIKGGNIPCNDVNGDGEPDSTLIIPGGGDFDAGEFVRTCNVDQRSSFAAPFQASVFGEFTYPVNNDLGFFLRGLFDFDGNSKNDPNNGIDDIDAYGILNLYTGLRDPDGQWELSFFGKNIFDTYRTLSRNLTPGFTSVTNVGITGIDGGGDPIIGSTGSTNYYGNYSSITSTAPQEFGVNLRFKFGSDN